MIEKIYRSLFHLAVVTYISNNRVLAAEPSCTERCPADFERVPGLSHCYRLMLHLGPVSYDKAMIACGAQGGATLVTFDNPREEETLRNFMFDNYKEAITADLAYLEDAGFWTGYARMYRAKSNPFKNIYSGDPLTSDYFSPKQPNNVILGEYGQENCVARKKFSEVFLHKRKPWQGLDDYTCGFPHWVICMHRDVYALNQQAYNTVLMNNTNVIPPSGHCELDWVNQNMYQLYMMRAKRLARNDGNPKQKDIDLADSYLRIQNQIRFPECPECE
ncbi:uncharacterized protein LOC142335429 [Convolutriloba macropyga]|uniref:uncharacterized protein LOC142335429 n=1 Tax=Convolutriloba macropyga TaxID=536237 RepID=UPI003F524155